jgi:hypothetical protein
MIYANEHCLNTKFNSVHKKVKVLLPSLAKNDTLSKALYSSCVAVRFFIYNRTKDRVTSWRTRGEACHTIWSRGLYE